MPTERTKGYLIYKAVGIKRIWKEAMANETKRSFPDFQTSG